MPQLRHKILRNASLSSHGEKFEVDADGFLVPQPTAEWCERLARQSVNFELSDPPKQTGLALDDKKAAESSKPKPKPKRRRRKSDRDGENKA